MYVNASQNTTNTFWYTATTVTSLNKTHSMTLRQQNWEALHWFNTLQGCCIGNNQIVHVSNKLVIQCIKKKSAQIQWCNTVCNSTTNSIKTTRTQCDVKSWVFKMLRICRQMRWLQRFPGIKLVWPLIMHYTFWHTFSCMYRL